MAGDPTFLKSEVSNIDFHFIEQESYVILKLNLQ